MLEKALQIASHITTLITLAAFVAAFLGVVLCFRAKNKYIARLLASGLIAIAIIAILGQIVLAYRDVYRITVTVVNPDGQPANDAEIKASTGEKRKTDSGWELVVSPQTKPSDGKVTIYASLPNSFLAGESTVDLGKDYYPSAEIQLKKRPSVTIRGEVIDAHQKGVAGANVVLPECSQAIETDRNGLFSLPSCVAQDQRTSIRAEKGNLAKTQEAFGGQFAQIQLAK
jgi:hypothetical protein